MVKTDHPLPVTVRCRLVDVARSRAYYCPKLVFDEALGLMRLIDEIHLQLPCYGSRRLRDELEDRGHPLNRKRVQRLMRLMGRPTAGDDYQVSIRAGADRDVAIRPLHGYKLSTVVQSVVCDLSGGRIRMNGIQTVKAWIGGLTNLGLALIALAIVASVLVGPENMWAFGNVVEHLVSLIVSLGDGGLAGLIAVGIIIWLLGKVATSP